MARKQVRALTGSSLKDPEKIFRTRGGHATREQLNRVRWSQGLLGPETGALVRPHQESAYKAVWDAEPHSTTIILCHRQFGKSYLHQLVCDEKAKRQPNWLGILFLPQKAQGQAILRENFQALYATCPMDLRPKEEDGFYSWPSGKLYFAGTDDSDQRERLRGQHAHDIFIDEAASHKELKYLVRSIVGPMTDTTNGRIFMLTTLPKNPEHEFMEFLAIAEAEGKVLKLTIDDNTHYTPAQKRRICKRVNAGASEEKIDKILAGECLGNSDWEREYKLNMVADDEIRVCPEFNEKVHVLPVLARPQYIDKYVTMDQGHAPDFFAILFAEYDFASGKLRILAEWMGRHKATQEIVASARTIEAKCWPEAEKDPSRYSDDPRGQQQLQDMREEPHKYYVTLASKSPGDEEQSRAVRYRVNAGQIEISSDCKNLIAQLKGGVFKFSGGKAEFERSKTHGHLDCFSALAVLVRTVNWKHNGIPANTPQASADTYVRPKAAQALTPIAKKISSIFRSGRNW